MQLNNYDELAKDYLKTNIKPDKLYSILPTVLMLVSDLSGKTVLDLGCGDGFFTHALAKQATKVVGLDNSKEQIGLANLHIKNNTEFLLQDIFVSVLPKSDIVVAPFVANYAKTVNQLTTFFKSIFESLSDNGKLILVVDLPSGKNLEKFGAKKLLKVSRDEQEIKIQLFDKGSLLVTLFATYFTPETIERTLKEVGFNEVTWYQPIISKEGINELGNDFWEGYQEDCELGYVTATKI